MNKKTDVNISKSITAYVESNASSLANPDARSNRARYSVMAADIRIGLDNPIWGVGRGLRNAYMIDYFDEKALANYEVQMWLRFIKEQGILRAGIPALGEYTSRFAETGLLGLGLFLLPLFVLLYRLYEIIKTKKASIEYVFFTVSLAGIIASGIGDSINITYCYWVLLGLGYAMCFGKEKIDKVEYK